MLKKTNKPIELEFYMDKLSVSKNLIPVTAKNSVPSWWKSLSNTYEDTEFQQIKWATVKKCIGAIEIFGNGVMVPLVEDLQLSTGLGTSATLDHWILNSNYKLDFLLIQSSWTLGNYNRDITIIPKVITSKGPIKLDIEVLKHPYDSREHIPKGTYIFQIIPLIDKNFVINIKELINS